MRTPIQYPFARYATWIAAVGPSITAEFLNLTEDGLGDMYGALLGRSATWRADEFLERNHPPGQLGGLTISVNTNAPGTMRIAEVIPSTSNEHGLVKVVATNAGSYNFLADDAFSLLDTFDFVWSARVLLTDVTVLSTVGSRGFQVGLFDTNEAAATSCRFVAGSDELNWQAEVGAFTVDTGVAVTNGWVDLQMARINGLVTGYIDGALVSSTAHAVAMPTARRRVGSVSPGAAVGDGFQLDYFRLWMAR